MALLDGKLLAAKLKDEMKSTVAALDPKPGLGTILVGLDPGSNSYVAGKHRDCSDVGINSLRIDLPADATDKEIFGAIEKFNNDPLCTGFILQLPLPGNRNEDEFLAAIDPKKDCDGLHPINLGKLLLGVDAPRPCTPAGIIRLLTENEIELAGAHVVIVGRGLTVGRPLAILLSEKSNNATVSIVHTGTKNPEEIIKTGDIVIVAIGKKYFLKPEMIKRGAVVVDVGITRENGEIFGDVDPAVAEVASFISPTPGGVGPMTRAMLLKNLLAIYQGDFQ